MNTNLRALAFGAAVAVAMTLTLNTVFAAETPEVIRLDGIEVVAHRDVAADDGVVRLAPIVVTAHRTAR